jgi:hypothetical protein
MRPYAYITIFTIYCLAVVAVVAQGGAPFTYPLDDTYIHMAIARTLAIEHLWGVVPGEPAAASSSPLWTLLLAALYKIYPSDNAFLYVPLALNVLAAALLIFTLARVFHRTPYTPVLIAAVLFAASTTALSALGMEHVLHAALVIALGFIACSSLEREKGDVTLCAAIAALSVAARYESLFVVAPLAGICLLRGRLALATAVVGGAAVPVLAFGALWIHDGGWLLPNSLILKRSLAEHRGPLDFAIEAWRNAYRNYQVVPARRALLAAAGLTGLLTAASIWLRRRVFQVETCFAVVVLAAVALHFAFAATGWLYRYEAWLILLLAVATVLLATTLPVRGAPLAVAVLLAAIFAPRTLDSTRATVQAMDDRRLEHIAPAEFVARNYAAETIMVNDLGAVAWFAPRTRSLDIYGLGTNEPIKRILAHAYGAEGVADWATATHTRIAILQLCWPAIRPVIPANWSFVASWKFPRNVVFRDRYVGFYAVADGEDAKLRERLKALSLPAGVTLDFSPDRDKLWEQCYDLD